MGQCYQLRGGAGEKELNAEKRVKNVVSDGAAGSSSLEKKQLKVVRKKN